MELRNWKLYFPITYDPDKYHKIIGGLSDFLIKKKPNSSFVINGECRVVGNIYGYTGTKLKDGDYVKTSPVLDIVRISDDVHDFILRTKNNEFFLREKDIDPKFRDEAWTYGTPGLH